MSELRSAVEAEVESFRPVAVPPLAGLVRQAEGRRRRRHAQGIAAAVVLLGAVSVGVAVLPSGNDRLTGLAAPSASPSTASAAERASRTFSVPSFGSIAPEQAERAGVDAVDDCSQDELRGWASSHLGVDSVEPLAAYETDEAGFAVWQAAMDGGLLVITDAAAFSDDRTVLCWYSGQSRQGEGVHAVVRAPAAGADGDRRVVIRSRDVVAVLAPDLPRRGAEGATLQKYEQPEGVVLRPLDPDLVERRRGEGG